MAMIDANWGWIDAVDFDTIVNQAGKNRHWNSGSIQIYPLYK